MANEPYLARRRSPIQSALIFSPPPISLPRSLGSSRTASVLFLRLPQPALPLASAVSFAWKHQLQISMRFVPFFPDPDEILPPRRTCLSRLTKAPTPSFTLYSPTEHIYLFFSFLTTTWHYICCLLSLFICLCYWNVEDSWGRELPKPQTVPYTLEVLKYLLNEWIQCVFLEHQLCEKHCDLAVKKTDVVYPFPLNVPLIDLFSCPESIFTNDQSLFFNSHCHRTAFPCYNHSFNYSSNQHIFIEHLS